MSSQLTQLQDDIQAHLEAYFANHQPADVLKNNPHSLSAFEKLSEFSLRPSKRVRGALAIAAYEAYGGTNKEAALDLAAAIELYHAYLLIIDDVMDRSEQRRGAAAVHTQYRRELADDIADNREAEHVSNMLAISVGLLGAHMSAELMSTISEKSDRVRLATRMLNQNMTLTGYGQLEDILNTPYIQRSDADVLHIYTLKTSYYTFINPLQVGAALAGEIDETAHEAITTFGLQAGVAYQLQDDIIGLFGDEKTSGKSHLDDLKEGKMTVLMRRTLQRADDAQKSKIHAILGQSDVSEKDREDIITIIENIGTRADAEKEIDKACAAAESSLDDETLPLALSEFLRELLAYITKREK